jgi:hypothetical protein
MSERAEIEALRKEFEAFKSKYLEDQMEYLNFKIDVGSIRRAAKYNDESIGKVSTFFAGRTTELRARVDALEATVFKHLGDFTDVQKIIGPPNEDTPPDLDKPKGFPRR